MKRTPDGWSVSGASVKPGSVAVDAVSDGDPEPGGLPAGLSVTLPGALVTLFDPQALAISAPTTTTVVANLECLRIMVTLPPHRYVCRASFPGRRNAGC